MKVVLASVGTRGDVQPMLALGKALASEGYEVVVSAPADAESLVTGVGLPYHRGSDGFQQLMDAPRGEGWWKGHRVLSRMATALPAQFARLGEVCSGADAVVGSMLQFAGPSIADALGVPYFYAVFSPIWLRSSAHPPVSIPWQNTPRWVNALLWQPVVMSWNVTIRGLVNRERERLLLPAIPDAYHYLFDSGHTLFAFDPRLAPVPGDVAARGSATGFWVLEQQRELSPEVEAFLSAGPPPVYFGFGSMHSDDPASLTGVLIEAAERLGRRALISAGRAGLGQGALPRGVLAVGDTPHERLFPRVASVVHHGGAGTFAAAARAGAPQVLVPHIADQYYWGERARALGLGPPPLLDRRLRAARVAEAIEASLAPSVKRRANEVATSLQATDGTAMAVRAIEGVLGRARAPGAPPP